MGANIIKRLNSPLFYHYLSIFGLGYEENTNKILRCLEKCERHDVQTSKSRLFEQRLNIHKLSSTCTKNLINLD